MSSHFKCLSCFRLQASHTLITANDVFAAKSIASSSSGKLAVVMTSSAAHATSSVEYLFIDAILFIGLCQSFEHCYKEPVLIVKLRQQYELR